MTRGLSIWLDALRVWATIIVVLSHVAYPRFTRGDYIFMRDLNLGSDSVIVFFVISGLVIAYAAGRDNKLSTYTFNRATRLLSVLVPALLLTFAFDQIGRNIGPEAYNTGFYNPLPLGEMLLRGVTMSNEWGAFDRVRLGTNGPLWSLSYEAAYYILFAAAFFLTGARRMAALVVIAMLVGPRVFLLMPAWLMGVWLWNWVAAGGPARLPIGIARLCAWAGPVMYMFCLWSGVPDMLATITGAYFEPVNYRLALAFSDEFIWNAMVGVMTVIHIMGMARLLHSYQGDHPRVRWWAGASFSIYVTHYPALHLIDAVFPAETLARDGLLVAGSILVGLVFAHFFERRIKEVRQAALSLRDSIRQARRERVEP
ncbi:acyltransferase [Sulfitobacter sp. F26169L]|uniref:acyltransferase family protein n=1 Tax=Sulfitobacter sp. F26169L TaxID=2996015 RepID=UPI002260F6DD|nr:acyltransferase [Sulfitobacter sp. F26169L]MCX7567993.1 acyltransferase [Sulfitobacter sp. F26169L]